MDLQHLCVLYVQVYRYTESIRAWIIRLDGVISQSIPRWVSLEGIASESHYKRRRIVFTVSLYDTSFSKVETGELDGSGGEAADYGSNSYKSEAKDKTTVWKLFYIVPWQSTPPPTALDYFLPFLFISFPFISFSNFFNTFFYFFLFFLRYKWYLN